MIYSLFRFGNKGQKRVKKSVILGVNGLSNYSNSFNSENKQYYSAKKYNFN